MKKRAIWGTVCCLALGASLVACVPQPEAEEQSQEGSATTAAEVAERIHNGGIEEIEGALLDMNEEYAPEVKTLEDGTQVQSAPESNGHVVYRHLPNSYNGYWLNSDERGCNSCHEEGLADLVINKMPMKHHDFLNGLDTEVKPMDCGICHDEDLYDVAKPFSFGELIHGIHSKDSFKGDCMSCHTATSDGQGLQLWEEAKYDVLQGMQFLPDVQGDFSYDQDTLTDGIFNLWWPNPNTAVPGAPLDHAFKGDGPDDEIFNSWEITVSGEVDKSYTTTLGDLIKDAPSETFISKTQCINNPPGGELVANVEVTGIPVSWLLEKAGLKDTGTAIVASDAYGYADEGFPVSESLENGNYLVYQINGRPLTWNEGYPVRTWGPGHSVATSVRWVSELEITDTPEEDIYITEGWEAGGNWTGLEDDPSVKFMNIPNAGIMKTHEGQIIPVGQSYEFEGYADASNEQIVAMEFSFDRGETWTRFDTSDSDVNKWVYWRYSFTPEEPGGYVLSVRSITDTGRVTLHPDEIMVIAK